MRRLQRRRDPQPNATQLSPAPETDQEVPADVWPVSTGTGPVERLPPPEPVVRGRAPDQEPSAPHVRTADARLARLHLRGGMLTLARAELEHMAGTAALDQEALVDLAETRWRSGDLEGGAEAAQAHLAAGGDEPMAHLIVAEQAEREGRILDARQRAMLVQQRLGEGIERLFAGERRSAVWPVATPSWMDTGASAPGRWGLLVGGREISDADADTWPTAPQMSDDDLQPAPGAGGRGQRRTRRSGTGASAVSADRLRDLSQEAGQQLDAAEHDLARGDLSAMVDRLALLLRLDPALAPVILSIAERAISAAAEAPADLAGMANAASLQLLRGDIYRGLGRDMEAADAYQEALRALPGRAITMESTT